MGVQGIESSDILVYIFLMEQQSKYFLKYFRRKTFEYQDPHSLINFRVIGISPVSPESFGCYYNFNISCEKLMVKNFSNGLYEHHIIDKKLLNVRRTNLYMRIDIPQIVRGSFSIFNVGDYPYRIIIKNIYWNLK